MISIIPILVTTLGLLVAGKILGVFSSRHKRFTTRFEPIGRYFIFDNLLISSDFPAKIKRYRPSQTEWDNAKRLGKALDFVSNKFGKPKILSGGRPPSVGDFYKTLTARGYKPSRRSQHNVFAAVDVAWSGGIDKADVIYSWLQKRPEFLQVIYYRVPGKPRFHLSVPEPDRPNLKAGRLIKQ